MVVPDSVRQRSVIRLSVSGGQGSGRQVRNSIFIGVDGRRGNLGHGFDLHVAMLQLPLVILFEQNGADPSNDRCLVWKDADHVGSSFDLLVQALDRVGRVDFGAMLGREVHIRQHIGLASLDEGGEFGEFRPQLVGDMAQRLACSLAIRLDEGLAQGGGDYAGLGFRDVGKRVSHPVHTATLPACCEHAANGSL